MNTLTTIAAETTATAQTAREVFAPHAVSWVADPIAARILADLALNPPPLHIASKAYAVTRDEWVVYDGPKVDALRAIYERFADEAMIAADAGNRGPWEALLLADPLRRDGYRSIPKYLWESSSVDRVVFEAVQGRVS